jgi:site-specific recombinase XerD
LLHYSIIRCFSITHPVVFQELALSKTFFPAANPRSRAKFLAIRDKAMLETIYSCGLRAQETANLNWRDIDFRAGFIGVNNGKGGKDRIVPIGEKALVAL